MLIVEKVSGFLARMALWLSGFSLVLMTVIIAAQVFYRYVLNSSLFWSQPSAILIMGWFIFLGGAVGIREGYHLSFDVFLYVLPRKAKLISHSVSDLVVTFFGFGMFWYGWELADETATNTIPSIGISGAYHFVPIIIGGALIMLFSIERIMRRAVGLPIPRFGETEGES